MKTISSNFFRIFSTDFRFTWMSAFWISTFVFDDFLIFFLASFRPFKRSGLILLQILGFNFSQGFFSFVSHWTKVVKAAYRTCWSYGLVEEKVKQCFEFSISKFELFELQKAFWWAMPTRHTCLSIEGTCNNVKSFGLDSFGLIYILNLILQIYIVWLFDKGFIRANQLWRKLN